MEALKYDAQIVSGEREIVGVNCYTMEEELHKPSFFRRDPDILKKQRARMAKLKADRNNEKVKAALDELAEATKRGDNVMPMVMKAIREYATLGEIMTLWRQIFAPQAVGKRLV
jgi:methylmalonyl-CoA mutase N-terminal domain/subunit